MIVIRECSGFDELEACVQLQIETWGYDDSDIIPRKAFLVAQKIGGQVLGAFDTDLPGASSQGSPESMVGFAMSLPGVKTGPNSTDGNPQAYLHSHMLAVRDRYRDRGLGAQLKLEQRREALSRGIRRIEWTFDPLEIKTLPVRQFIGIAVRGTLDEEGFEVAQKAVRIHEDSVFRTGTVYKRKTPSQQQSNQIKALAQGLFGVLDSGDVELLIVELNNYVKDRPQKSS